MKTLKVKSFREPTVCSCRHSESSCHNVSCKLWWKQSSRTALRRRSTKTAGRRECACAWAIVIWPWNDTRLGIWVHCRSAEGWRRLLAGGNPLYFCSLVTRLKPWISIKAGQFPLLTERVRD
jgi:hypothetical protein